MSNIFKTITSSLKNEEPTENEINEIPSYIFCRWLSGSYYFLQLANIFNRFSSIPIVNQFYTIKNYNKYTLKQKVKYIPYPKQASEKEEKDLQYISKYYKCSLERAKEYLEFISDSELNRLRNAYSED